MHWEGKDSGRCFPLGSEEFPLVELCGYFVPKAESVLLVAQLSNKLSYCENALRDHREPVFFDFIKGYGSFLSGLCGSSGLTTTKFLVYDYKKRFPLTT